MTKKSAKAKSAAQDSDTPAAPVYAGPELPGVPETVATLDNVQAVGALADWLKEVARRTGRAGVDHALGEGWPGTPEQRGLLHKQQIDAAYGEAMQYHAN